LFRLLSSLDFTSAYLIFFCSYTNVPCTFIYTLSLHDALPISFLLKEIPIISYCLFLYFLFISMDSEPSQRQRRSLLHVRDISVRSEEHTSELQSRFDLVFRLLLEKKNVNI